VTSEEEGKMRFEVRGSKFDVEESSIRRKAKDKSKK
jgi:hypothetical protein